MPTTIKQVTYRDNYSVDTPKYNSNVGDYTRVRIDFTDHVCITSSQTIQPTINALTGEISLNNGSWLNEGFLVGDVILGVVTNNLNVNTNVWVLTILAIPSDLIMVVSGLPNQNNLSPTSGEIWQFYSNRQKEGLEILTNFVENNNTSATPSMLSLIDSESQKLVLSTLNTLAITSGVGAGTILTQVGKKSGSYSIQNMVIYRFPNDTFGNAIRYNYSVFFEVKNLGLLFPTMFAGTNCIKIAHQINVKTLNTDTKVNSISISDSANTGFFNEGYNNAVSNTTTLNTAINTLSYNKVTSIPFSFVTNTTNTAIVIGASYVTLDDAYNENQIDSQDKYLKLLKTSLLTTAGGTYVSSAFSNDYYTIKLNTLSVVVSGAFKTISGTLIFDPRFTSANSFGKFIEQRGSSDRLFYIWIQSGNTNNLVFGNQLTFDYPIGEEIKNTEERTRNHDDNTNYFSEVDSLFYLPLVDALDINTEDDLAYVIDFPIDADNVLSAVTIDIVCRDLTSIPSPEFSLEKMVFDISTQTFPYFTDMFQNVTNNLPSSSIKKQAYLKYVSAISNIKTMRLYYPFLIRWEYWLKQLNATALFVSQNKNNKDWFNYTANILQSKLFLKLGVVRNGVLDYYYKELEVNDYDFDTNVVTTISIIDNATSNVVNQITQGNIYTIVATHYKVVGNWALFPYGQITVEEKESQPRFVVSTEIDADVSASNPLIGNSYKRLDVSKPDLKTVIYSCTFDATNISGSNYCFTSKISEQGLDNNPVFELKITEDNINKITEDLNEKILE